MRAIWKFELIPDDYQIVLIPAGAVLLTVQVQGNNICLWGEVETTAEKQERIIEIFGTGHKMPGGDDIKRKYISTFQLHGGALVFHVFERIKS